MSADERFRRRSPYWRPGMSVLVEPWVALAETNAGHLVRPCGRDVDYAMRTVAEWSARRHAGQLIDTHRTVVAAAVVNPHGDVIDSWAVDGDPPDPWGAPRWSSLRRLAVVQACQRCGELRWPGCWMASDLNGCAECLPGVETADPRPCWPHEPARPPVVSIRPPAARKPSKRERTMLRPSDF